LKVFVMKGDTKISLKEIVWETVDTVGSETNLWRSVTNVIMTYRSFLKGGIASNI
jgi:hypothetical protein